MSWASPVLDEICNSLMKTRLGPSLPAAMLLLATATGVDALVLPPRSGTVMLRSHCRLGSGSSSDDEVMTMVSAPQEDRRTPTLLAAAGIFPRSIQEPADLLPYMAVAMLIGWRGKKAYKAFVIRQDRLVEDYGKAIGSAATKKMRKSTFLSTRNQYRRKLLFLRNEAMLARAVGTVVKQRVSIDNVQALRDLLEVSRVKNIGKAVETIGAKYIDKANERGRLLYYAGRLGAPDTPNLRALCLRNFRGDAKLLAATQATIAETAFTDLLKASSDGGPYQFDADLAATCGVDKSRAQAIVDDLNRPPEDADTPQKEEWLQELESVVENESGPIDFASDNTDKVDAFGNAKLDPAEQQDEGKMLTVECGECGYTMFIAKNREFKFFGPTFSCPNCQAPRSKFSVTEADSSDAEPPGVFAS